MRSSDPGPPSLRDPVLAPVLNVVADAIVKIAKSNHVQLQGSGSDTGPVDGIGARAGDAVGAIGTDSDKKSETKSDLCQAVRYRNTLGPGDSIW